jgi:hypothetical protein
MARLTVSYSVAFIPGLPRPLALSEVVDDVLGLSSFSSRHTVRKQPGTPDRLDIVVPVDDLPTALDCAAKAADELTRIGESLLGLGFVVEERALRIDGLTDNWVPDTFDGAGTRTHAPTALDAAAPLPDELEEPRGDVPDEDLRLDNLHNVPAADLPHDPSLAAEPLLEDVDAFSAELDALTSGAAEPLSAAADGEAPVDASAGDEEAAAPASPPDLCQRTAHRHDPAAARRRHLLRQQGTAAFTTGRRARARAGGERRAFALFALAFVAAVAPWRLPVSAGAIGGLAVAAAGLVAGAAVVWPDARGLRARIALTGTVTLAVVLAFASAYAICADEGDLRGTGDRTATVGQSLSAAVSLGAAPGLSLGPGARAVAYAERLLILLALAGAGAHVVRGAPARSTRRDPR